MVARRKACCFRFVEEGVGGRWRMVEEGLVIAQDILLLVCIFYGGRIKEPRTV